MLLTPTLQLDIVVFKEDGAFVVKAPLTVPNNITLAELKEAICTYTTGALPPHRQELRYLGQKLSAPGDVMLVGLLGSTESITLTLSIINAKPVPNVAPAAPAAPAASEDAPAATANLGARDA